VDDPDWVCKIDEGLAGLCHAWWSPDSRHIITATDFQVTPNPTQHTATNALPCPALPGPALPCPALHTTLHTY
jgi:hypothetical protein